MKFSVNDVPRHFSLKTLNPSLVNSDFEFIGIALKWSFKMFQTFSTGFNHGVYLGMGTKRIFNI